VLLSGTIPARRGRKTSQRRGSYCIPINFRCSMPIIRQVVSRLHKSSATLLLFVLISLMLPMAGAAHTHQRSDRSRQSQTAVALPGSAWVQFLCRVKSSAPVQSLAGCPTALGRFCSYLLTSSVDNSWLAVKEEAHHLPQRQPHPMS